jgi:hypothetical protein
MNSECKLNLGLRFFLAGEEPSEQEVIADAIRKHVTKSSAIALRARQGGCKGNESFMALISFQDVSLGFGGAKITVYLTN